MTAWRSSTVSDDCGKMDLAQRTEKAFANALKRVVLETRPVSV